MRLRDALPHTKLLLLRILPSDRSPWISQAALEINKGLAAHYGANDGNVTYLDISQAFMRNGSIDAHLYLESFDSFHLSSCFRNVWR
jgi:hypothetical protein